MCLCRLLLLHAHIVQILCRAEAALASHADHTHAHKPGHGARGVSGGGLHGVGGSVGHSARHHKRVGAHIGGVLQLVDLLHVLGGQGDGVERDLADGNAPVVDPLLPQGIVHGGLQFICLCGNLRRTQLLLGQCAESRLQSVNKLGL